MPRSSKDKTEATAPKASNAGGISREEAAALKTADIIEVSVAGGGTAHKKVAMAPSGKGRNAWTVDEQIVNVERPIPSARLIAQGSAHPKGKYNGEFSVKLAGNDLHVRTALGSLRGDDRLQFSLCRDKGEENARLYVSVARTSKNGKKDRSKTSTYLLATASVDVAPTT